MADTLKAKEQLDAVIQLFQSGKLAETASLVVIPRNLSAPSAKWSLLNRMLQAIHGTGDARGLKQWNAVGRSVKAGSKAFCILGPSVIKDKKDPEKTVLVGFHGIPVFRLEDTKGDALPDIAPPSPPVLSSVAEAWGLKVFYAPFQGKILGQYRPGASEIMLCTHEEEVFFHELAHASHMRLEGRTKDRDKMEIVAEMSACVLARVYGIKAHEDKMQAYVTSYAEGKDLGKVLTGLLSEISKTINQIIETANSLPQGVLS